MKRAQVAVPVYFTIFEILLLVMVAGIVYLEVKNISDSGIYQKKFLSRDLALVLDSLTNARGNLVYFYNPPRQTLSKFAFDLRNNRVTIDNDESWPYATNARQELKGLLELRHPFSLVITKSGNAISIGEVEPARVQFNGLLLDCPGVPGEVRKVIIDPGHGYNVVAGQGEQGFAGKGAQGNAVTEAGLMLWLGVALRQSLLQEFRNLKQDDVVGTKALEYKFITLPVVGPAPFLADEARVVRERVDAIAKNRDALVISLHAGSYQSQQNAVKAFVNKDADSQTYRLACSMLNVIAERYLLDLDGTAIVPVDVAQLDSSDPRQVLLRERVAVQLEIGNMQLRKNTILADVSKLAAAIAAGVRSFAS